MTAPQYPQYQPAQPQYAPSPTPSYAPPAPSYQPAPQYAPPAQYQAPQYAPPAQPQYQQPAPQYAPPAQPLAQGTLDQFFSQASVGGGKALKFDQVGQFYAGIVARPITQGDISQMTSPQNNQPRFFRDGSPMFQMTVPLVMAPSQQYPDGLGTWYVKGATRDELVRAMDAAGAPQGPPEAGAYIHVTFTGTRPSGPGFNPSKIYAVHYTRPQGVSNGAPPAPPAPAYAPPQAPAQPAQPVATAPVAAPPAPAYQPAPAAPQNGSEPVTPAMTPDHEALMRQLLAQQAQQ